MPTVSREYKDDCEDDYVAFVRPESSGSPLIRRPSLSTADELSMTLTLTTLDSEDFQSLPAPSALLPELVKRSLKTPPPERSSEDIGAIFSYARHLPPLTKYSDDIKQAICSKCVLAHVPVAGTILYSPGVRMDSWSIILNGEVESVSNEGRKSLLSKGDNFGVCPHSSEQSSSSSVRSLTPDCHFLLISQQDFVEAVQGQKVRKFFDEMTGEQTCEVQLLPSNRYILSKATTEKLVEWLTENYWAEWDQRFLEDFFLTYRTVMSSKTLFQMLIRNFEKKPSRISGIVLQWMNGHFEDFDLPMMTAFQRLLESLNMESELLLFDLAVGVHSSLRSVILKRSEASDALGFEFITNGWYVTKSDRSRLERGDQIIAVNGHKMDQVAGMRGEDLLFKSTVLDLEVKQNPLGFKHALKEATKPKKFFRKFVRKNSTRNKRNVPSSPKSSLVVKEQEKKRGTEMVIKTYRSDQSFRYIAVYPETSALFIVPLVLKEFGMTEESSSDWTLTEVTVTGEGVIKQHRIADHICALPDRIRSNNRFYLKAKNNSDIGLTDEVIESIAENPALHFLSINAADMADCLMDRSFKLFNKIKEVEFIKQLFKLESKDEWKNLSEFERLFNWEVSWVVSVVCSERNVQQRVRLIKKFIKIADHSRTLKNLNSMFAIISGLENRSVCRLRSTWDKIPHKYLTLFEQLKQLSDPTKNMMEYRKHFAIVSQEPPVIPILPFLYKDLYFADNGNLTWCEKKLVNFSKLRMVAEIVRNACNVGRDHSKKENLQIPVEDWKRVYEKTETRIRILDYLNQVDVTESEHEQDRLSLSCEPRRKPMRTPSTLSSKSSHSISSGKTSISSPWTTRRIVKPIPMAPPAPPAYNERLI
ncbi:hypothetical protein L596_007167 [Steinernema carpocapsae]|uniref:Uncharacterized protein n=1 Tax=Steinernema carpocapsae TaxID=34508 RepID=A0A4U5P950_STECR|nr:hypothetical protein L596_007167 [Steinernema carpocapsae]